jgi:hypothetical protein
MTEIKTGNRRVVFNQALLIPDGEESEFVLDSPKITIGVKFGSPDDEDKKSIRWASNDGKLTLVFGRDAGLASSTPHVARLGAVNGKEFSFAAFYHRTETMGLVHLQLFLEA